MVCNIFEQKIDIYFIVFRLIRERGWADTSGYIITPQPPRPKTNNYWQFCILRPLLVMAHVISAFFWMAQSQLNEMNGFPKLHIPSTVVMAMPVSSVGTAKRILERLGIQVGFIYILDSSNSS